MLKQKVTIMLMGLICFSSISGFSTVICHGSDGHIAVELLLHDHCECPETNESDSHYKSTAAKVVSSVEHDHCQDYLASSDVIVQVRKNVEFSAHKVITANFILKHTSNHTPSIFSRYSMWSNDLSSFYLPLRTIVLLA